MRRILLAGMSLAALAACSGGDAPNAPSTAITLETASATSIVSNVSAVVAEVPSVTVRGARGAGVAGVEVRWAVLSGGGTVASATSRTNSAGVASSGGWTLGPTAGQQRLQASVSGAAPVVFTATAEAAQATRLVVVSSLPNTVVGTAVAASPAVRAEDAAGRAVPGVPVTFAVVLGGGSLASTTAVTNGAGVATSGTWTLGTSAGTQTLRASSGTLPAAEVNVTAVAAAPAAMSIVAGDGQTGAAGVPLSQPPVVRVVDAHGNNAGNVPVTFTPGAGSGTVTGGTVQTDPATGTAVVSAWTLGTAPSQTLVATSSMLPGKSVTFRATVSSSQFDIDVRFVGEGGTDRQRQAFASAVSRWRQVIVGDNGSTTLNTPAGECADWIPAIGETINDLVIFVRLTNIDGPGKVLGQASPCYVSSANKLPVMGFFELDTEDLALLLSNGTLDDVVLHEMGHILGIGTLWSYQRNLLAGRGTDDPYFTGLLTRDHFSAIGGLSYAGTPVPVENTGGTGTRDAHWRRTVFSNELMQGYARPGGMPMSRVTVASLADLGYTVTYGGADGFSFFPAMSTLPSSTAGIALGDDIARSALWEVQRNGNRRKVRELQ